jgi:Zn-dependent protease
MRALPANPNAAHYSFATYFERTHAVPINTRRKRSLLRHFKAICSDSKWISAASLLISFAIQWSHVGPLSAAAFYFILASHEAGHLMASWAFNIPVLWPVFIPKIGAIIVLKEEVKHPYQEAWLGISGPITGLTATGIIHLLAIVTRSQELAHCAAAGYAIHVFNLIPLGDLDGGHIAPLVGRWLWIPGALMLLSLLVFFTELPWHVTVIALFILWNGCSKIWKWLQPNSIVRNMPWECTPKTRVGMALLYGVAVALSVLGLLASI